MNRQLLELLNKYPNANIYTFTYYELVCEDHGYWLGKLEKVYYGKFWTYEENIYFTYDNLLDSVEDGEFMSEPKKYEGIIILINNI